MKKTLTFVSLLALTGCASIIDGTHQSINLVPSDGGKIPATVESSSGSKKVTLPAVINVDRSKKDIVVKVEDSKCYDGASHTIQSSMNPMILLNVLSGGLLGSTTDFSTGAAWEYDNNAVVYINKKDTCAY
jgi:hypothetical protein